MTVRSIEAWVSIDVDLDEFTDKELEEELLNRGIESNEPLDREDWFYLLDLIDKSPQTWYTMRVRSKIFDQCHKERV